MKFVVQQLVQQMDKGPFFISFYYLSITPLCKLLALGPKNEETFVQKVLKKAFQDCMQIRSAARLELLILDNSLIWGLAKLVLNSHVLMNSYDPRSSRKKTPSVVL